MVTGWTEDPEKKKERNRQYYLRNKERLDAHSKKRYEERILALKMERGGCCERCGYDRVVKILQFHHRNPKEKLFSVSSQSKHRPMEQLRAEADKCDLLCPNCHYELTYPS